MLKFVLMVSTVFGATIAHADCNMNLAIASAKYLVELEKAKLYSMQGGGACAVLQRQYYSCSPAKKARLARAIDLNEVFGNICLPHLSGPTAKN